MSLSIDFRGHLLLSEKEYYRIDSFSREGRTVVLNDGHARFLSWQSLVGFVAHVARELSTMSDNPISQFVTTPKAANMRHWLVEIDQRVSEAHERAWVELLAGAFPGQSGLPQFRRDEIRWGRMSVLCDDLGVVLQVQGDSLTRLTGEELVALILYVLSDPQTYEVASDQWGPFLVRFIPAGGTETKVEAFFQPSLAGDDESEERVAEAVGEGELGTAYVTNADPDSINLDPRLVEILNRHLPMP